MMVEAFMLDNVNGNILWQDAIKNELKAMLEYVVFEFMDHGVKAPDTIQHIPCLWEFELKMDLHHHVHLVV